MVYIYKKKVGNKEYYYLRASERKGEKIVVKDLAYLGSSIGEAKKALENMPKYKDKIRKTYKTIHNFLESNIYLEKIKKLKLKKDDYLKEKLAEIEACKLHYTKIFQRQDSLTKEEILKNFVIEFAHNTTAIEGNTISLKQAKNLLEEGRTPKNKTLREIYDLQNTERTFNDLLSLKEEIDHNLIIDIHKKLLDKIDKRIGYRNQNVRVLRANFKSTPAPYVKTDMDLLLKWYNNSRKILHPFVLAIIFHHKFEKIHPFMDGNGRTGRMLSNYILMRNNFPPIILTNKNREKYLKNMRIADKSDPSKSKTEDYKNLVQFSADEMTSNYWNLFL